MLLKIIAEGPLNYVGNGFNVFDGVIVILRWVEDVVLFTSTLYCDDAENALFIHASYIDRIDRFPRSRPYTTNLLNALNLCWNRQFGGTIPRTFGRK